MIAVKTVIRADDHGRILACEFNQTLQHRVVVATGVVDHVSVNMKSISETVCICGGW